MGSNVVIVMDTCVIIWDALEPSKLTSTVLAAINQADQQNNLMIADISIWEIAMLIKKGRINIEAKQSHFLNLYLQSRNIIVAPITPQIAEQSVNFDARMNNDPADRIIAATAKIHNACLVTADNNLLSCDFIDTLWS